MGAGKPDIGIPHPNVDELVKFHCQRGFPETTCWVIEAISSKMMPMEHVVKERIRQALPARLPHGDIFLGEKRHCFGNLWIPALCHMEVLNPLLRMTKKLGR